MPSRRQEALDYHAQGRPGKIQVSPTKPFKNQRDLSLAYTPGVAEPCREIAERPDEAYSYTAKGNLWMVAMYADGLGISGLAARYTFQSWNFRDVEAALSGAYPLQVRALGSGADVTAAAYPGSGNYFRLLGTPTTPAAAFRLASTAGGLVTFPGVRLYIVRTQ